MNAQPQTTYPRRLTPCGETFRAAATFQWQPADLPVAELRRRVTASGSHYFSTSARRFFGARNFHMAAPGVSVELQTAAPGNQYHVTAWQNPVNPEPFAGCWHATLTEADNCAARYVAEGFALDPTDN